MIRYWTALLSALVLLIISVFFLDKPIALWSATLSPQIHSFASTMSWLIAPETYFVALPILFFLFFYLLRKKKASILIYFIVSLSVCILGTDLLKVFFGRARPEELYHQGIYGFALFGTGQPFWSFPSGHGAAIGALMGTLAELYPKRAVSCLLVAFVLSLCRIFSLSHFLSDLLAAIIVSFLLSKLVFNVMSKTRLELPPIQSSKRSGS